MASLLVSNSYIQNSATNTDMRAWCTAISNAFANSGWTKVNDAGTIDLTTFTANGTASNNSGFEIWKMSDALAATYPVVVKIEYGTSVTTQTPTIWATVGTGTNGTGGLTGVLSTRTTPSTGASSVPAIPSFFCGDTNRMALVCGASLVTNMTILGIERTHDAAGNDTSEGVLIYTQYGTTASTSQQYWNCRTGPCAAEATLGVFIPANSIGSVGPTIQLYPIYLSKGVFLNPMLNFIVAPVSFVTVGAPISFTYYGATHTYMPVSILAAPAQRSGQTTANFTPLMRWE